MGLVDLVTLSDGGNGTKKDKESHIAKENLKAFVTQRHRQWVAAGKVAAAEEESGGGGGGGGGGGLGGGGGKKRL